MASSRETPVAGEAWSQREWESFELWEKVEERAIRRRRLWIAGGVAAFILLSAIPAGMDREPKWRSLRAARELSQLIGEIKTRVALEHRALRFSWVGTHALAYRVERSDSCLSSSWELDREGLLRTHSGLLPLLEGDASPSLCFDHLKGLQLSDAVSVHLGIVPSQDLSVKDLTAEGRGELREDRVSWVVATGSSAVISFE